MAYALQSATQLDAGARKTAVRAAGWLSLSASPVSPGRRSRSACAPRGGLGSKCLALQPHLTCSPLPSTRWAMRAQEQHPEGQERRRNEKAAEGTTETTAGLPLLLQPVYTRAHMGLCLLVWASACVHGCVHTPLARGPWPHCTSLHRTLLAPHGSPVPATCVI